MVFQEPMASLNPVFPIGRPLSDGLMLHRGPGGGRGAPAPAAGPLLAVQNHVTRVPVKGGLLRRTVAEVHAVQDVSFDIQPGQMLGPFVESGSGTSTCRRSILRPVEPASGEVSLAGQNIRSLGPVGLRRARRDMQMVSQDPFASLNPDMRPSAGGRTPAQLRPLHRVGPRRPIGAPVRSGGPAAQLTALRPA